MGNGTSIGFAKTFSDEFHVFSIEWNEEGIEWFLDDVPFFSVDNDVSGSQNYPFHEPFFFIMNVAVGGLWPGYPDATTTFPQFMAVDYVRVSVTFCVKGGHPQGQSVRAHLPISNHP